MSPPGSAHRPVGSVRTALSPVPATRSTSAGAILTWAVIAGRPGYRVRDGVRVSAGLRTPAATVGPGSVRAARTEGSVTVIS